jgi:hypothetical protein
MDSISVNYKDNNIIITKTGKTENSPITITSMPEIKTSMPEFKFNNSPLSTITPTAMQQILRKLDCLKDAKEGNGISAKDDIMTKIFPNANSTLNLNQIKEIVFKQSADKIDTHSWLKSSSLSVNLTFIKNVFFETGLSPKSYIKNYKNPSEQVFNMIGCFQNEVGDPFLRKTEDITIRYPEQNISLTFDASFMGYFGFSNTTYSSKLVGKNEKGGLYNYEIDLGSSNKYGSDGVNKIKESGTPIERYNTTIINNNVSKDVSGDEYFKGNDYKNDIINILNVNQQANLPEIKRYIIGKELGDVMQVLLMMIWQIAENTIDKKEYCMVTIDSIVFLLCIMLEQPCFYTHNSNKGKSDEDKCYRIQYFFPTIITPQQRIKMRFEQKYNETLANNLKIKNFINKIYIEKELYIGNVPFDYTDNGPERQKLIEDNFINPIRDKISQITTDLEDFYTEIQKKDTIEEKDLIKMNSDFLLLPFIGFNQTKTLKKYYLNGNITNYTETILLEHGEKKEKYSFKNLFLKLRAGTLKNTSSSGGSQVRNQRQDIFKSSSSKFSSMPNKLLIQNTKSSSKFNIIPNKPSIKIFNMKSSIEDSSIPNTPTIQTFDTKSSSKVSSIPREPLINNFTDSLFFNFIIQILTFMDDPSLKLNEDEYEDKYEDKDSSFYYYYNMICYISYIQKRVYYDDNLLSLMKQLKKYNDDDDNDKIPISDIINNIYENDLNEEDELNGEEDELNENTPITVSDIKSTKAYQFMTELIDTLNEVDKQPIEVDKQPITVDNRPNKRKLEEYTDDTSSSNQPLNKRKPEPIEVENPTKADNKRKREEDTDDTSSSNQPIIVDNQPPIDNQPIEVENPIKVEEDTDDTSSSKKQRIGGKTIKRKRRKNHNKTIKRNKNAKKHNKTIKRKRSTKKHNKTIKTM